MGFRLQAAANEVTRNLPSVVQQNQSRVATLNNCNAHTPSTVDRRCSFNGSQGSFSMGHDRDAASMHQASASERQLSSSRAGVIRMLTAVVVSFFLCWAPFHAQRLCYVYFNESPVFRTINEYLYYISGFLYYLSATLNPILYNLMSLKYREAFKRTLCTCTGLGGSAATTATTAASGPATHSYNGSGNRRSATVVVVRNNIKRTSLRPSGESVCPIKGLKAN